MRKHDPKTCPECRLTASQRRAWDKGQDEAIAAAGLVKIDAGAPS